MNKLFHHYYSKNIIKTNSSRGLGSSSGIIKLSSGNYKCINLESSIKKNLLNSTIGQNQSNNNTSIKDKFNENNQKNQIKFTKNNISTSSGTNNYFNFNNQNKNQKLLLNNKTDINIDNSVEREINFDFYKNKDISDKNFKNSSNIKINSNCDNNLFITNKNKKIDSSNKNEIDNNNKDAFTENSVNKKSIISGDLISSSYNVNNNINSINKTSANNKYTKKLSTLNSSSINRNEKLRSVYNKKTTAKNSPRSSAINKTLTSALKNSATYNSKEYLICIIENYAREVGISAYNYRTSEYFITQFIDTENYINTLTMINYWRPIEIVMNQKSEDSSLYKIINKTFKHVYIGFLPRNKFNMDYGKEIYMKSNIRELSLIKEYKSGFCFNSSILFCLSIICDSFVKGCKILLLRRRHPPIVLQVNKENKDP